MTIIPLPQVLEDHFNSYNATVISGPEEQPLNKSPTMPGGWPANRSDKTTSSDPSESSIALEDVISESGMGWDGVVVVEQVTETAVKQESTTPERGSTSAPASRWPARRSLLNNTAKYLSGKKTQKEGNLNVMEWDGELGYMRCICSICKRARRVEIQETYERYEQQKAFYMEIHPGVRLEEGRAGICYPIRSGHETPLEPYDFARMREPPRTIAYPDIHESRHGQKRQYTDIYCGSEPESIIEAHLRRAEDLATQKRSCVRGRFEQRE
ncbi:hypothetical protein M422DRAFT_775429 [Sphaerobolus stellatus SS14]|nr:hypothetical protein M422DRAFT_775429 [Sphaerobolus stellatus SS14]